MDLDACSRFTERSHEYGLTVALAGSVKSKHLPDLASIGTDIVGIRGAVCSRGDRNAGQIQKELIASFRAALDESVRMTVA
jgi:uncharacterized protein (UPF0264 family)